MKYRPSPAPILALLAACALAAGCADRAAIGGITHDPPPDQAVRFTGRDPGLARPEAGGLNLAYVVDDDQGRARVAYRHLDVDGGTSPPVLVSPPELAVSAHGEVPPAIVALPSSLVVAYTVRLPGKWKGEIRLQRSADAGATWSTPELLHDDAGRLGSHGFVSAARSGDAAAFAWLDDRDGAQGLRTTRVGDDGTVEANRTTDDVACQCCATALLADGDALWLAYRDLEAEDVRDIALARSRDLGGSFEQLGLVSSDGWRIQGCPHTGPRLARAADGALWAIWFTGAEPGIYAAASADGGVTFGSRQALARPGAQGLEAVAHPEIVRLGDGRLVAVYEAVRRGARLLEARVRAPRRETWGPPIAIAEDAVYPRAAAGEGPLLAYSSADGSVTVVDLAAALDRGGVKASSPAG